MSEAAAGSGIRASTAWRFWVEPARELLSFRRHGTLSLLVLVSAVGSVGSGIALLALPFFLVDRGFGFAQIGVLYAVIALAEVAVQVAVARSPWLVRGRGAALGLLVAAALAWPGMLLARSPLAFVFVLGVASIASAAAAPAMQASLARAGADRAPLTFAASGLLNAFGNGLGLVAGGLLVTLGYSVALYGAAVVSLAGLALTAWLLASAPPTPRMTPQARRARRRVERAWSRLAALRGRLSGPRPFSARGAWAATHAFLFSVTLALYPFYFPWLLLQRGVPMAWVGVFVALSWFAYALAQPLGAWAAERVGKPRPVALASLAVAALLNALLALPLVPLVVATWVLLGVADGMGRPLVRAMLATGTQEERMGVTFSWLGAAESAAKVAGPFLVAAFVLRGGVPLAFVAGSVVILLSAVPILLMDARPAEPAPGGAAPA